MNRFPQFPIAITFLRKLKNSLFRVQIKDPEEYVVVVKCAMNIGRDNCQVERHAARELEFPLIVEHVPINRFFAQNALGHIMEFFKNLWVEFNIEYK